MPKHQSEIPTTTGHWHTQARNLLFDAVVGIGEGIARISPDLIKRIADLLELEYDFRVKLVSDELPDSGIAVLALGDLDGWTVAAIEDEEREDDGQPIWVEGSTGDRITVLKWMHLPAGE